MESYNGATAWHSTEVPGREGPMYGILSKLWWTNWEASTVNKCAASIWPLLLLLPRKWMLQTTWVQKL